jgi:hypothetical protein
MRLSPRRVAKPSACIVLSGLDGRRTVHVENLTSSEGTRVADQPIRGLHVMLPSQSLIAIGQTRRNDPLTVLEFVFATFQRVFAQRFILTRLTLRRSPPPLGVILISPARSGSQPLPLGFDARFNGRDWCSIRMVPR